VEVLNPLARDYKSIGTMKKELAELQEELSQAHNQVWKIHFDTNCIFWFPVFTTSGYSG